MSQVASLSDYRGTRNPERDVELRRLALQLAVQLPNDGQEALTTIGHMETLVRGFLGDTRPA